MLKDVVTLIAASAVRYAATLAELPRRHPGEFFTSATLL
jgi:hypothetical protein